MTHSAWTGIGYIKENPTTKEAGYMLSGGLAGGMTVVQPSAWPAEFVYAFEFPYADEPNTIPEAATSIVKINNSDLQYGTAGELLPSLCRS